jgi:hypothetical protein
MGRPKKARTRCDPEECKYPVYCACGLCTRHCQLNNQCPSENSDPQLPKTPAPSRSNREATLLAIRAGSEEKCFEKNVFDMKALLEAFPPDQSLANCLPLESRSRTIEPSNNSKYWEPLMLYIDSIIETVCVVFSPNQVKGMRKEVMHRLATRNDNELATLDRVKAKRVAALKMKILVATICGRFPS